MEQAVRRLEGNRSPDGKPYEVVMHYGTMHVGLYAPRGSDPQKPDVQDEVYFVMRGQGQSFGGDMSKAFVLDDMLFVPAGLEHRFVVFTNDFTV